MFWPIPGSRNRSVDSARVLCSVCVGGGGGGKLNFCVRGTHHRVRRLKLLSQRIKSPELCCSVRCLKREIICFVAFTAVIPKCTVKYYKLSSPNNEKELNNNDKERERESAVTVINYPSSGNSFGLSKRPPPTPGLGQREERSARHFSSLFGGSIFRRIDQKRFACCLLATAPSRG